MTTRPPRDRAQARLRRACGRLLAVGVGAVAALVLGLASAAWAVPAPAFTSEPGGGASASPTWTWTSGGPTVQRVECTLTAAATGAVLVPAADCGLSYTANLTEQVPGSYTLSLVAYDGNGTPSSTVTSSYAYAPPPPPAPVITGSPGALGPSTSVSWSFTHTPSGATPSCTLVKGGVIVQSRTSCTSPAAFTLGSGDGVYTFGVSVLDSPTATSEYELDSPPPAPTVTGPTGPSKDKTPIFQLSGGGSGDTWSCALTAPGGAVTTPACAAGSLQLSLTDDGTYSLAVSLTDAAGSSSTTTVQYVLDTKALAAPIVTGPSGPSQDRAPVFTLTAEAGVTWSCTVNGPNGPFPVGCSEGTWTFSLATAADGEYVGTITVSKDGRSASTIKSYTLDTTAPAPPGVATPASPSNDTTPVFTLSGETGATYACTLTSPSGVVSTPACGAGPLSPSLTGEGTWTLSVVQTDVAGNVSAATTRSYVLDTTGYPAPEVSGPTGPSNVRTPAFTLTGDAAASWSCTLVGPSGTTTPACGPGQLTLNLPGADGSYALTVTLSDAVGNTSSTTHDYELDTTGYAAPGVSGPTGPSNVRTPAFTLTGDAAATWTCTLTSPEGGTTTLACGPGALELSLSGDDGSYLLTVTLTDEVGNASSTSRSYVLSTMAFPAPVVTGPSGPSQLRAPVFTLSGEETATWTCVLKGPGGGTTALPCGPGKLTLSLPGADGAYLLTVTLTDAAGNESSTTVSYVLDTTAPGVPGVSGPAGPSNVREPVLTLTGDPTATWSCTVVGPDGAVTTPVCGPGELTLSLPGADGSYLLTVTVTDAAGNSSSTSHGYLLDTSAFAAPGISGPTGPSNARTPVLQLTGAATATWSCTLTAPGGTTTVLPCGPGELVLSLPGADGSYLLTVTLTDATGNASSTSHSYLLDTTPPSAPDLTGEDGAWALWSDETGTWECWLTGPDGVEQSLDCGAGSVSLALDDLEAGTWVLSVRVRDDAGNPSGVTERSFVRVPGFQEPVAEEPPPPVVEPPVEQPPVVEPQPVVEPPVAEPPVAEPPAEEPPVVEPPVVELPAAQPPMVEPPVQSAPAEQPPMVEPPAEQPRPVEQPAPPSDEAVEPTGAEVVAPADPAAPPADVAEPSATPLPPAVERPAAPVGEALRAALGVAVAESAVLRVAQRLSVPSLLDVRWRATLRVLEDAAAVGGIPLLLLLLVVAFLAVQDRIDKNDPKLALAPVFSHQELPFRPVGRFAT